jgi:spermidine/putrescine transport system permease protein
MGFFVACPLLYILALSFVSKDSSGNILWQFTLNNYIRIFDPVYFKIFLRSMGISLLTALMTLLIGYPFSYSLTKQKPKQKALILLLVMIPFWMNSLLRAYGIIILLRKDGILNSLLLCLNIIDEPLQLLYTYGSVIAGMVYMLLPFMILPLFNSIEKLDKSYVEASRDLGAGKVKTFLSIILPLTSPGIISGVTLVFILAVGLFFVSDLLGGAKTMLVGNLIQMQMTSARDWPFGAAVSITLIIVVISLLLLYMKAARFTGQKDAGGDFFG